MSELLTRLGRRFESSFPAEPRSWRQVGREGEHPVVHPDGTAGDISVLWPHLAESGNFKAEREGELLVGLTGERSAYTAEVGRGTMEVIVGPERDLHGIREAYEAAIGPLVSAADREGLLVLGYGIQPLTPPALPLLSAKRRYHLLHDAIGDAWLWFALTASDQVHVEVSRPEVIATSNLVNLLAPVTVALFANSPVHSGKPSGAVSAREAGMGTIEAAAYRHGMPVGPAASVEDWVSRTLQLNYLMHRDGDELEVVGRPFAHWAKERGLDDDALFRAWGYHDHYIWNSARPRTAHGTLELRAPCQQPWADHMTPAAFGVGVVSAHREIAAWLEGALGDDAWPAMRRWHHEAMQTGLEAPEPVPGLLDAVLGLAREALVARGRGEEVYLTPLETRVARGRSPGQEALRVFEVGGIDALVAHTRIA